MVDILIPVHLSAPVGIDTTGFLSALNQMKRTALEPVSHISKNWQKLTKYDGNDFLPLRDPLSDHIAQSIQDQRRQRSAKEARIASDLGSLDIRIFLRSPDSLKSECLKIQNAMFGKELSFRTVDAFTAPDGSGRRVKFPSPPKLDQLIAEMWQTCQDHSTADPILDAVALHVWILQVHPFEDGNGRLSRMLLNRLISQILECEVYLPIFEINQQSDGAHVLAVRRAIFLNDWSYLVRFFEGAAGIYSNIIIDQDRAR